LEGIEDIKSNNRYEVVLEGIDKDGNEFDIDDTRYCFLVSAGSSVPSLEVSEPAKSVTYVKKEAAAHFEGIAESRSGGDNAYCTVYATINGKESDKINGKFNSDLDWTLDIPSEKFSQSISETYTVKIIARDENGLSVSKEFSVYSTPGDKLLCLWEPNFDKCWLTNPEGLQGQPSFPTSCNSPLSSPS
jgi:hypothetical protein